jgi:rhodanese-related sulfurtransferase
MGARMSRNWWRLGLVTAVLTFGLGSMARSQESTTRAAAVDFAGLGKAVDARLTSYGRNVSAAIWVGGADGAAWYERGATTVMPTASAVKTFYLVELFAAHEQALDQPLPDAATVLNDDHPAVSHFPAAVREEIRRELGTATVRRVGEVMMGKTDVSNAVYNAAANLVTASLGGPEKLTEAIHRRDPRFQSVVVRRYMLRDRTQPGDNEGTAAAFAGLYQALASRKLAGINKDVMSALHQVLRHPRDVGQGALYEKTGGLGTEPLTAVNAGWVRTDQSPIVFVVMTRQPVGDESRRTMNYDQLRELSRELRDMVISAGAAKHQRVAISHTSDSLETVRKNLKEQKAVLLDVREQAEWDRGHLAEATLVPLGTLKKDESAAEILKSVPTDKIVYTHCAAGVRVIAAGEILKTRGYDVRPLSAGYDELVKQGFEKAEK